MDLQKRTGCNRLSLEIARAEDGPSVSVRRDGSEAAAGATGPILLQPIVTKA